MNLTAHRIFLYAVYSVLVICLFNVGELKGIRFTPQQTDNKTVVDPSGYYNLTHKPAGITEESNARKDKSSAPFVLDFFGLPAIIYLFFFFAALRKEGVVLSRKKKIVLVVVSWLIFEATSYAMIIVGLATLGLGTYIFPLIFLLALWVYLFAAARILQIRFPKAGYPLLMLAAVVASALPLIYVFKMDFNLPLMAVFYIIFFQLLIGYYFDRSYATPAGSVMPETENPGTLSS